MRLPPNIQKIFGSSDNLVALLSMCATRVPIALGRLWPIARNRVILVVPLVVVLLQVLV